MSPVLSPLPPSPLFLTLMQPTSRIAVNEADCNEDGRAKRARAEMGVSEPGHEGKTDAKAAAPADSGMLYVCWLWALTLLLHRCWPPDISESSNAVHVPDTCTDALTHQPGIRMTATRGFSVLVIARA